MQYTLLGNTGLIVSRVTLGTMTFTDGNRDYVSVQKVDTALADRIVGHAFDLGINFFDTANMYSKGESEVVLGKCLKGRRQNAIISSKVGLRTGPDLGDYGLSRRNIISSIDATLKRLDTDYLDIYIAHRDDLNTPLEETLEAFDAVVRAGKVRYIGFSNWSAWRAGVAMEMQKAHGWARFTHGQMHYSLLSRDVERDVIPMMRQFGLGMTVWSPLSTGFLTGKFDRESIKIPGSRFSEIDFLPIDYEYGFRVVDVVREIADRHGVKVSQVALAWLLSQPVVSSIIIGTTKTTQLEENVAALSVHLTTEDFKQLDEATKLPIVYPNWFIDTFIDPATVEALAWLKK